MPAYMAQSADQAAQAAALKKKQEDDAAAAKAALQTSLAGAGMGSHATGERAALGSAAQGVGQDVHAAQANQQATMNALAGAGKI